MAATGNRGGGRRSKGDRKLLGFRMGTDKADKVSLVAKAEGYRYVSDWLADLVEERLNSTDLCNTNELQTEAHAAE